MHKKKGNDAVEKVKKTRKLKKGSLQMETVTPWGVVLKPVLRDVKKQRKSKIGEDDVVFEGLELKSLDVDDVELQDYETKPGRSEDEAKKKVSIRRKKSKIKIDCNNDDDDANFHPDKPCHDLEKTNGSKSFLKVSNADSNVSTIKVSEVKEQQKQATGSSILKVSSDLKHCHKFNRLSQSTFTVCHILYTL